MRRVLQFILCLFVLAICHSSAFGTKITIVAQSTTNWQFTSTSNTSPPHIRIFSNKPFVASTGEFIQAGSPGGNAYYQDIACTQNNATVTCPSFIIDSTTDASAMTTTARYDFWWFDSNGNQIATVFGMTQIAVPPTIVSASGCSPAGLCASWSDLVIFSRGPVNPNIDLSAYTKGETDAKIAANLGNQVPVTSPFIIKTPVAQLANAQALSLLPVGSVLKTISGGGLAQAVNGTDYIANISGTAPITTAGTVISVQSSNLALGSHLSFGVGTGNNTLLGTTGATINLANTVVATDQVNTFGAFAQTFQAGSLFRLVDPTDTTKIVQVDASGITTGNTRTVKIPDAASSTAQSFNAISSNWLRSFNQATGAFTASQPAASDLTNGVSGSGAVALVTTPVFVTNISAPAIIGLTSSVTPNAAAGATVGTAALPFSSVFVGSGANNSAQLTGTFTGNRVVTFPDNNSVTVIAASASSNQVATGISAGGVISFARPVFDVQNNGALVGTRQAINLIPGSNITYTIADNGGSNRVDVTINGTIGSTTWNNIGNPTGNQAMTMAGFTSTWTWNNATGASNLFTVTDTASNTGTGIIGNFLSATNSTAIPFQATAGGSINGVQVNTSGIIVPLGTGGLSATGLVTGTIPSAARFGTALNPQFNALGINQAAPATNGIGITGQIITNQANLTVASLQTGGTINSNDNTTKEFYDTLNQSTLNPQAGNGNKTFVALGFNLIESATTGIASRFFIKAYINSVPSVPKWTVDDAGNEILAGNLTAVNSTFSGTLGVTGAVSLTAALTVPNGGIGATSLTANGVLYGNGTSPIQATSAVANGILQTNGSSVPSISQTPIVLTSVQAGIAGTSTGSFILAGSTAGTVTQSVPNSVTSYAVKWPATQGGANTVPQNDGAGNLTWVANGSGSGTVTASPQYQLAFYPTTGSVATVQGNSGITTDARNDIAFTPTAQTNSGGSSTIFAVTGPAHTNLAAGLENLDVNFNLARSVSFLANPIVLQRAFVIQAPTYVSSGGTSTMTTGATFAVTGPPVAGSGMTITNPFSIYSQSGHTELSWNTADTTNTPVSILGLTGIGTGTSGSVSNKFRALNINVILNDVGGVAAANMDVIAVGARSTAIASGGFPEAGVLIGGISSKNGSNAYAVDMHCSDVDSDGSGSTVANLRGIISSADKHNASSTADSFAFMAASGGTLNAHIGYGFWGGSAGGSSLEYGVDFEDTPFGRDVPVNIVNSAIRLAYGQNFAIRNQAKAADVNVFQLNTIAGQNNTLQFNSNGGATSTQFGPSTAYFNVNLAPTNGYQLAAPDGTGTQLNFTAVGADARFNLIRGDGTSGAISGLQSGELIGSIRARGVDSQPAISGIQADMEFHAANTWSNTDHSTYIDFQTTPTGSTAIGVVGRWQSNGGFQINATSAAPVTGDLISSSSNSVVVYMSKVVAGRIVLAVNNGGTMEYLYSKVDGTTSTWTAQSGGTAP